MFRVEFSLIKKYISKIDRDDGIILNSISFIKVDSFFFHKNWLVKWKTSKIFSNKNKIRHTAVMFHDIFTYVFF